jgi:hypothetical protein
LWDRYGELGFMIGSEVVGWRVGYVVCPIFKVTLQLSFSWLQQREYLKLDDGIYMICAAL